MDGSKRWSNLGVAAGACASAILAVWDVVITTRVYIDDFVRNDFTFYYAAARIGVEHGWSKIYDLDLQQAQLSAMAPGPQATLISPLARFISPPPLAWLATPFSLLPFQPAYGLWVLMLVLLLVLAWRFAAPGLGYRRGIHLVAAFAWFPVAYGLQLGQPVMIVAAGVAASYALLTSRRDLWAGAVLGVMVVKPQLAFLVPLALLAAGRRKAFMSCVTVIGVLALLSVINVGPSGVSTLYDRLSFAGTRILQSYTLSVVIPDVTITHTIQFAIALWALALAYLLRGRIELVFAVGLVGGLLATPYLHLDDFAMLGLATWIYLRTEGPAWRWVFLLALIFAAEGIPVWGAIPVLIGELGALVLLTLVAAGRERAMPSDALREPLRTGD